MTVKTCCQQPDKSCSQMSNHPASSAIPLSAHIQNELRVLEWELQSRKFSLRGSHLAGIVSDHSIAWSWELEILKM